MPLIHTLMYFLNITIKTGPNNTNNKANSEEEICSNNVDLKWFNVKNVSFKKIML